MEVSIGSCTIYLDGLILHHCLSFLDVADLKNAAAVDHNFSRAADALAADSLCELYKSLRVLPRKFNWKENSRIAQLGTWMAVSSSSILWLTAEAESLKLAPPDRYAERDAPRVVAQMLDQSGHGRHAFATHGRDRMPTFRPDALGPGLGALEFSGSHWLETAPFAAPLPQPLTLVIVARARGDTTFVDSLSAKSARFELCHGYPTATSTSPANPEVCMSAHGAGTAAPAQMLRGATRSVNEWHVYTAIFDGDKSEMYVDGVREAAGKTVGSSSLDGLRIGCDHTSTFFLRGAVAELRLFSGHLAEAPRAQLEAALTLRYGLVPPGRTVPTTPSKLRAAGPRAFTWSF